MKYLFLLLLTIVCFQLNGQSSTIQNLESIEWLSWEEAIEKQKDDPKKIFVDVYTNWCGWCKKMDQTTFKDKKIVEALGDGFYAVKFNAEQREDINFSNNTFSFLPGGRRGGIHELAVALLDNKMGFPSFVLLDEEFARIMISPGFKTVPVLLKELSYAREELYKTVSWDQYNR